MLSNCPLKVNEQGKIGPSSYRKIQLFSVIQRIKITFNMYPFIFVPVAGPKIEGHYCQASHTPPLDILRIHDEYILRHTPRARFCYIDSELDGLLLDPKGIRAKDTDCKDAELYFCQDCHGSLSESKMPRLALNNHLSW